MYPVCEEVNIDLFINAQKLITFMCTPENLKELAIGHLYTRRIIEDIQDIDSIRVCNNLKNIYIISDFISLDRDLSLNTVLSSGCGNSANFNLDVDNFLTIDSFFSLESLKKATFQMFKLAVKHHDTGGMHSCALYKSKKNIVSLEDVGRHNAVDKVIGSYLNKGCELADSAIISTGRISTDMILKCVVANIPVVVSRSIPTTSALKLAQKTGITIVGRIMAKEPIIYTYKERIL